MKTSLKRAVCIASFALSTTAANAALIEVDLFSAGDGLITRDTISGLDWLDLTETITLSFDDIQAGAGGWSQLGFRHASSSEFSTLIQSAGLTESVEFGDPTYAMSDSLLVQAVSSLQSLIGITQVTYNQSYPSVQSIGVLSDPSTQYTGWHAVGIIAVSQLPNYIPNLVFTGTQYYNGFPSDLSGQGHGQFLVRETSQVPLPATAWLLGSGLLALFSRQKR